MELKNCTLSSLIGKNPSEFTLDDMTAFARKYDISMVNFMYPAADGRLKTLNFVIDGEEYLKAILMFGERVDGSSLFPFIEAGNSDLYVIPRLSTGFIDPFAELPTLCFLCAYFDKDGNRLEYSPEYTLHKAKMTFTEKTGMTFEAMGELEYYVSAPEDEMTDMYPATDQKGYHESGPFAKFNEFRTRCMYYIMLAGGKIKYMETTLAKSIRVTNEKAAYDAACKRLLSEKMILAWIMKECVQEYAGMDVREIVKYIEGAPQTAEIPVAPDEAAIQRVSGRSTEDISLNEGTVTYDIRFFAAVPAYEREFFFEFVYARFSENKGNVLQPRAFGSLY